MDRQPFNSETEIYNAYQMSEIPGQDDDPDRIHDVV